MSNTRTISQARLSRRETIAGIESRIKEAGKWFLTDRNRSRQLVMEALDLSRALKDTRAVAVCYEKLGISYRIAQEGRRAVHYLNLALDLFGRLPEESEHIALIHYNLGAAFDDLGELRTALDHYRRGLDFALRSGQTIHVASMLSAMGDTLRHVGEYAEAINVLVESLAVWESLGEIQGMAVSHTNIGLIHSELGNSAEALENLNRAVELYRVCGHAAGRATATVNIAQWHLDYGDIRAALESARQALELAVRAGAVHIEIGALITGGLALGLLRDFPAALEELRLALDRMDMSGSEAQRFEAFCALAVIRMGMENWEEAYDNVLLGLEHARKLDSCSQECRAHLLAAQVCEGLGRAENAVEHYRVHVKLREKLAGSDTYHIVAAATIQARMRKLEQQSENFRASVDRLERIVQDKSKELTSMAVHLAQKSGIVKGLKRQVASATRGDIDGATVVEELQRQIRSGEAKEAMWDAFERRLHEVQPEFLHALSAHCPSLTPMELRVCSLLRLNLSSKEIAETLNMALHTVNTHRKKIRMKLGIPSTTNLATYLTAW